MAKGGETYLITAARRVSILAQEEGENDDGRGSSLRSSSLQEEEDEKDSGEEKKKRTPSPLREQQQQQQQQQQQLPRPSTNSVRRLSEEERRLREKVHECRKHDWNRDTLALVEEGFNPCLVIGMGIAQSHSFLKRFHISRQVWGEFCTFIGDGYLANNPYHNAAHGKEMVAAYFA